MIPNLKNKPLFITFEGVEGCGKSTQSRMLYEYFLSRNINAILTREIGGTKDAESIRNLVLHSDLLPISELMLVMAARYEHIHKLIIPKLQENHIVICDRFIDSTACYQGICMEIGVDKVYRLHEDLLFGLMPDITFFIDIPPKIGLARTIDREGNNKFEDKEFAFHEKVYNGFQMITKQFQDRIVKIDAVNLSKEELHQRILVSLSQRN